MGLNFAVTHSFSGPRRPREPGIPDTNHQILLDVKGPTVVDQLVSGLIASRGRPDPEQLGFKAKFTVHRKSRTWQEMSVKITYRTAVPPEFFGPVFVRCLTMPECFGLAFVRCLTRPELSETPLDRGLSCRVGRVKDSPAEHRSGRRETVPRQSRWWQVPGWFRVDGAFVFLAVLPLW